MTARRPDHDWAAMREAWASYRDRARAALAHHPKKCDCGEREICNGDPGITCWPPMKDDDAH